MMLEPTYTCDGSSVVDALKPDLFAHPTFDSTAGGGVKQSLIEKPKSFGLGACLLGGQAGAWRSAQSSIFYQFP